MEFKQDFVPVGRRNRPGLKMDGPRFITIHDTGNLTTGAGAKAHADYIKGDTAAGIPASWHFTVDDKEIYQHIPMEEVTWNAGDGRKLPGGNMSSISIEICENADGNRATAVSRAAELVVALLHKFSLPVSAVVQHNLWSGKDCPHLLRANGSKGWVEFIQLIEKLGMHMPKPNALPEINQAEKWAQDTKVDEELAGIREHLLMALYRANKHKEE